MPSAEPARPAEVGDEPWRDVVLEVLEGCAPFAAVEAGRLGEVQAVGPTELRLTTPASRLAEARTLRRVVAAYLAHPLPVRRPREILETSRLRALHADLAAVRRLKPRGEPFTGVRLGAAGRDTPDMRRILAELADGTGLPATEDGDLLIRLRPAEQTGWEALLRLTRRPLSRRAWREVDYPGAVNATIAASVLDILGIGHRDSVLDMTCGSGTFLIEQLHVLAPARAVGVDVSAAALEAAQRHQRAAGRRGRIDWVHADVLTAPLTPGFTRILANPPWGTLHGDHATNQELLAGLLHRAGHLGAPSARLGILSHEIRRMHAAVAAQSSWRLVGEHRFFQKGHHPRLFLFERASA